MRRLRLTDAALVAIALVLLVGTAVSVARSIAFRQRLPSDRRAFGAWVAGSTDRHAPPVAQPGGSGDVLCAFAVRARQRQCLIVSHAGRVVGGFLVPPGTGVRGLRRSHCFGAARHDPACAV